MSEFGFEDEKDMVLDQGGAESYEQRSALSEGTRSVVENIRRGGGVVRRPRGLSGVLIDGGGKSRRRAAAEAMPTRLPPELRRPVRQHITVLSPKKTNASQMPVVSSIAELKSLTKDLQPQYPAFQVAGDIPNPKIFSAIFKARQPNVMAARETTQNVGAHFDHYYASFEPWALHHNFLGRGVVRACFLPDETFEEYKADNMQKYYGDPAAMAILAKHRERMGAAYLPTATDLLQGTIEDNTKTVLWHGSLEPGAKAPSVHDFVRSDGIGTYALYAVQTAGLGQLNAEGFVSI